MKPRFGLNKEGHWKKEEGLTDASLLLQNSSDREAKLLQELSTANENNIQLKNEVKKCLNSIMSVFLNLGNSNST